MYTGPLCEDEFVNSCLDVIEDEKNKFPGVSSWVKLKGLLYGIKTELKNVPLFYTIPGLTRSFKVSPPKLRVFYHWLKQLGFQVSGSHTTPNAIKTDAPASVVFDLVRIYVQQLSPSHSLEKAISLQIPEGIEIDFNIKLEESKNSMEKIPIYIPNPAAFWGPKPRAQQSTGTNDFKRQKVSH
jgi:tRNA (guanine26-N2/guanine27-N2)-dimethyltransferase